MPVGSGSAGQTEHSSRASVFSSRSGPRVPGSISLLCRSSRSFLTGAPSGGRPGSAPTSSGLAVTGFLCCASARGRGEADAKSARWQPRLEGADPYFVLWQCLPSLPCSEHAVPGPCAAVPDPTPSSEFAATDQRAAGIESLQLALIKPLNAPICWPSEC